MKTPNRLLWVMATLGLLACSDPSKDPGPSAAIGPRPVQATDLSMGTLFAAPDGSGTQCSETTPCDVWEVVDQATAGDVVFLRGGVYAVHSNLSFRGEGTATSPILYESYPGEHAIFDGSEHTREEDEIYLRLTGTFVHLRRFEIRDMPRQGLHMATTDNLMEGLEVHGSGLSGIQVHGSYDLPYGALGSRNVIRDCVVYDNDGSGIFDAEFADGGNSDGISISSGADNRVEHCLVYGNSDDGVDTWRSIGSYVGYTISHSNGIAAGNGQGIKAGGATPSAQTLVEHCLSHSNRAAGFDYNSGVDVVFRYNTSWNNSLGFYAGDSSTLLYNLAFETDDAFGGAGTQQDNSWQRSGMPEPMSTDPASSEFLMPTPDDGFADLGAHADLP
jgi:Right handed beta helix region